MEAERMLWMQYVRAIPQMNEWRNCEFATVGHDIYIFGYNEKTDGVEALIFNAKTYSVSPLDLPDEAENCNVPALQSYFAIAHKKKIYICGCQFPFYFVGNLLYCFDTETKLWTFTETIGEIPKGKMSGTACIIGNKVYICIDYFVSVSEGTPRMYALDLQTKTWECRCRHTWIIRLSPRGSIACGHRIYVLFIKWSHIGDNNDCIGCYDTMDGSWRWLDRPRTMGSCDPNCIIFSHAEDMYIFHNDIFALRGEGHVVQDNCLLKYSTGRDQWTQIRYRGSPLYRHFTAVVVVEDKAFQFCTAYKEVYLIDFFPSLRTLALQAVGKYRLHLAALPLGLKKEVMWFTVHTVASPN